jgi:hypothetical protein
MYLFYKLSYRQHSFQPSVNLAPGAQKYLLVFCSNHFS